MTVSSFERSVFCLVLTYFELNPSPPLNGYFLLTISSEPGVNLWWAQTLHPTKTVKPQKPQPRARRNFESASIWGGDFLGKRQIAFCHIALQRITPRQKALRRIAATTSNRQVVKSPGSKFPGRQIAWLEIYAIETPIYTFIQLNECWTLNDLTTKGGEGFGCASKCMASKCLRVKKCLASKCPARNCRMKTPSCLLITTQRVITLINWQSGVLVEQPTLKCKGTVFESAWRH